MTQKTPPRWTELGIVPALTATSAAMRWPIEPRTKTLSRAHCPAAHGTNYAVVVVCDVRGGGGRCARDSWREVDGVRGHLPGVI